MDGSITSRTDEMLVCNGTDIIPTICGFTGVAKPNYLKGSDLSKKINNPELKLRDTLVIETDFADNEELLNISGRAVITNDFKYIVYNKGDIKEQLFNLNEDPKEITNLAVNKSYKKKLISIRSYLKHWGKKNGDTFQSGL